MANLPLAFAELLLGAIVADAGIKGDTIANVVKGKATTHQLPGSASPTGGSPDAGGGSPGAGGILQSIFQAGAKLNIGRHDAGLDLEGPPNSPVFAPGNGYLVRNGNDPSGFGDSYPIVHFTSGPWSGLDIYFGHVQSMLSQANQTFTQGQQIATLQNGTGSFVGNAAGIPGHIEIGLLSDMGSSGHYPPGL